jgi:predicted transposase YbfD/YdcC
VDTVYLQEKFARITDTRHQSYVEHPLTDLLIIIMSAVLCGLDQLCEITAHAKNRADFFREHFGITTIPSKSTLSRVLNMMNGDEVASVIVGIMKERADIVGNIIAVDGKAIRSTSEPGKPKSALQILTAYLTESNVVLGQKSIDNKTNETPIFQSMLNILEIKGKTITADAMHCQKDTCRKIIKSGGNYVFGLKGNHKTLFKDAELFLNSEFNVEDIDIFRTFEKGHGRIEERICRKITDISWLYGSEKWDGLKAVFEIRRIIMSKDKTTDESCYYITSLDATAEELLSIVREHWKIESMHWVLDVVFSEDECGILSENGHKTLNILRKLAFLLHKRFIATLKRKISVKESLLNCLMSNNTLCQVLKNL